MRNRCKVVLYGDSLVLSGISLGLKRYPHLEVILLDASSKDATRELDALQPTALILDLSVVAADDAISLSTDHPDLLLIGLNPGGSGMMVFSGQQRRGFSTANLVGLIESGGQLDVALAQPSLTTEESPPSRLVPAVNDLDRGGNGSS